MNIRTRGVQAVLRIGAIWGKGKGKDRLMAAKRGLNYIVICGTLTTATKKSRYNVKGFNSLNIVDC